MVSHQALLLAYPSDIINLFQPQSVDVLSASNVLFLLLPLGHTTHTHLVAEFTSVLGKATSVERPPLTTGYKVIPAPSLSHPSALFLSLFSCVLCVCVSGISSPLNSLRVEPLLSWAWLYPPKQCWHIGSTCSHTARCPALCPGRCLWRTCRPGGHRAQERPWRVVCEWRPEPWLLFACREFSLVPLLYANQFVGVAPDSYSWSPQHPVRHKEVPVPL